MKHHAKAASAGPTLGRGASFGSIRCALATRDASSGVIGSGAPSHRPARLALALALAALVLLAFAPLSQAKVVDTGFGTPAGGPQAFGGQFTGLNVGTAEPRGIAVNTSGNGAPAGTAYVVDGLGSNRVQRFGPTGAFQRLWGQDTIAPSVNEQQRLRVAAAAGTYTLSFKGDATDAIPYNAASYEVDNALDALPSIGADANVDVSGNPNDVGIFYIAFTGALAASDQPQVVVDANQLHGTAEIGTVADGTPTTASIGTGFEICTVATECQKGSASAATANGGQLDNPVGVAVNQANGNVYVTEAANRRVSEFDADGHFIRAWGWDVIASGEPNDTGTGFEICEVAGECKRGEEGANGGEFAGEFGADIGYPVIDFPGNVWVPDAINRRIQEFDSSGNFIAAYGYDVDALGGGGELEKCASTASGACQAATAGSGAGQFALRLGAIAFDSAGNLYAIDDGNNRVQKFNSTFTTATNFGAATFYGSTPHPEGGFVTDTVPREVTSLAGGARLAFALEKVTGFVDTEPENPNNELTALKESQILELDPTDESIKDTSLVGSGVLTEVGGLSAGSAGNLYATVQSGFGQGELGQGERLGPPRNILVLGTSPSPDAALVLKPIVDVSDTNAVVNATVDPKGGLLSCQFEYSTDQSSWTAVRVLPCDDLDPAGGVQAISATLAGLTPNTRYFVRLRVSQTLLANSNVTSPVRAFDTDSVPPVVTDVGAVQVTDNSARLIGTIDPRNSATGYVFQYGPSPALGSSTAPLAVGDGTLPITVSQVVPNLSKDTTYYFRLLATNAFGSTASDQQSFHTRALPLPPANPGNCPNESLRQAQSSTYLPDCRAFEMVSPPDKNQGSAIGGAGLAGLATVAFARDGEGVAFCPANLFGEPPAQMTFSCAHYLATRGPDGWASPNVFPHHCRFGTDGSEGALLSYLPRQSYTRVAFAIPELPTPSCAPIDPAAPPSSINLYREDLTSNPFALDLITPSNSPYRVTAGLIGGGSENFSHIVYQSFANQTPDSPQPEENIAKLYDWEEPGQGSCASIGGCLHLLTVEPGGEPFTTSSKLPGWGGGIPFFNSISKDGERVYFQNPTTSPDPVGGDRVVCQSDCDLYMREGDSTTVRVSASECTVSCGVNFSPDYFLWASPGGDKALFVSCAKLTDASAAAEGATCGSQVTKGESYKLYRWDRDAPAGHRLVDLTVDNEPADGIQPHALNVIGAGDDGNSVYFVAAGQIVSGAPLGESSGTPFKLYRWSWNGGSPKVEYLAPYLSSSPKGEIYEGSGTLNSGDPNLSQEAARVTPDGRYLLLQTALALDPAADRDSSLDLYRWDQAGGWLCISCQRPGVPSMGNVGELRFSLHGEYESQEPEYPISDDGERVFFSTPDALLPEDVNGEARCKEESIEIDQDIYSCEDVYEWHDGTLSLLTSGSGGKPFLLVGATHTGDNVFIATTQHLVGWDTDNGYDVYDIRVDGGFPEPPSQPAICEGEACRGQATAPPSSLGAGTAVFDGPGNQAKSLNPKACRHSFIRRHGKCVKRRSSKGHKRARQRAVPHYRRANR